MEEETKAKGEDGTHASLASLSRALRSAGAPLEERLGLARRICGTNAAGAARHGLVLDWIAGLMVRSATSETQADGGQAHLSAAAWRLLHDVLLAAGRSPAPASALRVPLAPLFAPVVAQGSIERGVAIGDDHDDDHATECDDERLSLVAAACDVFRLATTGAAHVVRMSTDQLAALAVDVMQAAAISNSNSNADLNLLEENCAWPLVMAVLARTLLEQTRASNQKKTFLFCVQRLLPLALAWRQTLANARTHASPKTQPLSNEFDAWLEAQIEQVVMHTDHLAGLAAVLQEAVVVPEAAKPTTAVAASDDPTPTAANPDASASSAKHKETAVSFTKSFITTLSTLANDPSTRQDVVSAMPLIFDAACRAFRDRGKPSTAAPASFGLFVELWSILSQGCKESNSIPHLELQTLKILLSKLVLHDIFRAARDDRSLAQRAVLVRIFEALLQTANLSDHIDASAFESFAELLKLDHIIVADRLSDVWKLVVAVPSTDTAHNAAVALAIQLLGTFVKSRQLDTFFRVVLDSFKSDSGLNSSVHGIASSCIFDTKWTHALNAAISSMLPAQSVTAIELAVNELISMYAPADAVTASQTPQTPAKKKRKTLRGSETSGQEESPDVLDASGIVEIISTCFVSVSISELEHGRFSALADRTHDEFVAAAMLAAKDIPKDSIQVISDRSFCPALRIHLALIRASHQYWTKHVSSKSITRMMKRFGEIGRHHAGIRSLVHQIVCAHVTRQVGVLPASQADHTDADACREIVETMLESVDLNGDALMSDPMLTPTWHAILSNLYAVSSMATPDRLTPIVSALVQSLAYAPLSDLWLNKNVSPNVGKQGWVPSRMSAGLLQHPQFYDIVPVRDLWLKSTLEHAVLGLRNMLDNASITPTSSAVVGGAVAVLEHLVSGATSETISAAIPAVLGLAKIPLSSNPSSERRHASKKKKTQTPTTEVAIAFDRIMNLFEAMLVFPTAYFKPFEQEALAMTAFSIEHVVTATLSLDHASYPRFSLICRRLAARFMHCRESRMLTLFDPCVLVRVVEFDRVSRTQTSESTSDVATAMALETGAVVEMTVRMLLQMFERGMPKGSNLDAREYVFAMWACLDDPSVPAILSARTIAAVAAWASQDQNAESSLIDAVVSGDHFDHILSRLESCATDAHMLQTDPHTSVEVCRSVIAYLRSSNQHSRIRALLSTINERITELEHHSVNDVASQTDETRAYLVAVILGAIEDVDATMLQANLSVWLACAWKLHGTKADEMLTPAFTRCVQRCSEDRYAFVVRLHVKALEATADLTANAPDFEPDHTRGLLSGLKMLISTPGQHVSRRQLWSLLPQILSQCARLGQQTCSLTTVESVLSLALAVSLDAHMDLGVGEVSLVLGLIQAIGENTQIYADRPLHQREQTPQHLTVFGQICQLVQGLVRFHRDAVIKLSPLIVATLYMLFGAFRERPRLTMTGAHRRQQQQQQHGQNQQVQADAVFMTEPLRLFAGLGPLPTSSARSLCRVVSTMAQKPAPPTASSASLVSLSQPTAASLQTQHAHTVRPFSKQAPFILSRVVAIQSSMRPFPPAIKDALMESVFVLLDLCDDHGRAAVLAGLDPYHGGRLILKDFVSRWENEHRYKGKA